MKITSLATAIFVLSCFSHSIWGDTLTLKNGRVIEGRVVSRDANIIIFDVSGSGLGSRITVLPAEVASLAQGAATDSSMSATVPKAAPLPATQPSSPRVFEFPSAGIRIAFPSSLRPVLPVTEDCLLMMVDGNVGDARTTILFSAMLIDARSTKATLDDVADNFVEETSALMKAKCEDLSYSDCTIMGQEARVSTHRFWNSKTDGRMAMALWKITLPKSKLPLVYSLRCLSQGGDANRLVSLCQSICEKATSVAMTAPSEVDLPPLLHEIQVDTLGFAISVPQGWHPMPSPPNQSQETVPVFFAATDYLAGIKGFPSVNVNVFQGDLTGITVDMRMANDVADRLKQDGLSPQVVRLTTLGGLQCFEVVAFARAHIGLDLTQVQRGVIHGNHLYTLTVAWQGKDVARAQKAMEKIAASFSFIPVQAAKAITANGPQQPG